MNLNIGSHRSEAKISHVLQKDELIDRQTFQSLYVFTIVELIYQSQDFDDFNNFHT